MSPAQVTTLLARLTGTPEVPGGGELEADSLAFSLLSPDAMCAELSVAHLARGIDEYYLAFYPLLEASIPPRSRLAFCSYEANPDPAGEEGGPLALATVETLRRQFRGDVMNHSASVHQGAIRGYLVRGVQVP
jgi:hypothetical protein